MDNIEYERIKNWEKKEALKKKPTKTGKCKCGRKMIWDRSLGKPEMCGTCKTLGFEESRRRFLELNMNLAKVF